MNNNFEEKLKIEDFEEREKELIREYHYDRLEEPIQNEMFAGFWIRFFSFIVDGIVAQFLNMIIVDFALGLTGVRFGTIQYNVATTVVFLLYFTLMTYFNNGQTIGKMIFGLQVVKVDGTKLDFLTVFIRETVGRYIHTFGPLFILYIITAFTEKKQNLSDMLADTSVVSVAKMESFERGKAVGKYEILQEKPKEEILVEEI